MTPIGGGGAASAHVGVVGLAAMGRNMARNLARRGHAVAVYNRSSARTRSLVEQHGAEGVFVPAGDLTGLVTSLERPRRIVIMVRAGAPTGAVIDALVPLLCRGDVLADCGNAHFSDTRRREAELREHGIRFIGCGVCGGEQSALHGPGMSLGCSPDAYEEFGWLLEDAAARVDGSPCCARVGPDGAGHFVKMVHNGIEYADMQLIAEAYDLLRHALDMTPRQVAGVFADWNTGDLESFLIASAVQVLEHVDVETGRPFVDVVEDRAEEKGTGRWAVRSALDLGVPVTGMAAATFARILSADAGRRRAVHAATPAGPARIAVADAAGFADDVRRALYASKAVAYTQAFDQIAVASAVYGWNVDRATVAAIWRAGSIVEARLLNHVHAAYEADPKLPTLLATRYFRDAVEDGQRAWRRVVAYAATSGIPAPALASLLAYYDGLRAYPNSQLLR